MAAIPYVPALLFHRGDYGLVLPRPREEAG
jgi:hypothetical protein